MAKLATFSALSTHVPCCRDQGLVLGTKTFVSDLSLSHSNLAYGRPFHFLPFFLEVYPYTGLLIKCPFLIMSSIL